MSKHGDGSAEGVRLIRDARPVDESRPAAGDHRVDGVAGDQARPAANEQSADDTRPTNRDHRADGTSPADDSWNELARNETPTERLDRNWADLLQELRVIQTGVQLLTGFLLTIPFQARFTELTSFGQGIYLATLSASVVATGLLIAPVSLHRILFRRHARRVTVGIAHRLAQIGLVFLGIAIVGVVLLNFDVVLGVTAGVVAAAVTALLLAGLWLALPLNARRLDDREDVVDPAR